MFNLEQSIAEWRRQMIAEGIKTPVPLEELESHLREEIERQTKSGLDEAEAFRTSVQKMGQARALEGEFKKVEATKEERAWKLKQKLILIFASMISLVMSGLVLSKGGGHFANDLRTAIVQPDCACRVFFVRLGRAIGLRNISRHLCPANAGGCCGVGCSGPGAMVARLLQHYFAAQRLHHGGTGGDYLLGIYRSGGSCCRFGVGNRKCRAEKSRDH